MRHAFSWGIGVGLLLLAVAVWAYPGGSRIDERSVGFDWSNNYLTNLFAARAINGADNTSRWWAIGGWFLFCLSFAAFFVGFSKRIARKGASLVVRCAGILAAVGAFLAVTPLHDYAITVAAVALLVSVFYITVFLFKARFWGLGALSVACLLVFYATMYVSYGTAQREMLPLMQRVSLLSIAGWLIAVQYSTAKKVSFI